MKGEEIDNFLARVRHADEKSNLSTLSHTDSQMSTGGDQTVVEVINTIIFTCGS